MVRWKVRQRLGAASGRDQRGERVAARVDFSHSPTAYGERIILLGFPSGPRPGVRAVGASRSERRTCVFVRFEATLDLSDAPDAARVRCGQRPGTETRLEDGWGKRKLGFRAAGELKTSRSVWAAVTETHTKLAIYLRLRSHRPRSGGPPQAIRSVTCLSGRFHAGLAHARAGRGGAAADDTARWPRP